MKKIFLLLLLLPMLSMANNGGRIICDMLVKSKHYYHEALIQINGNDQSDIHDPSDYLSLTIPAPTGAKCVQLNVLTVIESRNNFVLTNTTVTGARFGIVDETGNNFYATGDDIKSLARPGFSNFNYENNTSYTVPLYNELDGTQTIKYQSLNIFNPNYPTDIRSGLIIIVTGYWF